MGLPGRSLEAMDVADYAVPSAQRLARSKVSEVRPISVMENGCDRQGTSVEATV